MPSLKTRKPRPDPTAIYRALQGFIYRSDATGADETIGGDVRLRGDHEAVTKYPQFFVAANVDDLTLIAAQKELVK